MKKASPAAALLFLCTLLTGCGGNSSQSAEDSQLILTVADTTARISELHEETTTAETTETTVQFTTDTTELPTTAATTATTRQTLFTTSQAATELHQGGEGGEEHGSDPDPLFFNYRFGPDVVSMRLAGGNYQSIGYDFSGAIGETGEPDYFVEDCDFDGDADLAAVCSYDGSDALYAIFLWDAGTLKFNEEPVLVYNPRLHRPTLITSLKQESDTVASVTAYEWEDGSLKEIWKQTADYAALTLTDSVDDSVTEFDDQDALTAQLLARHTEE